VRQLHRQSSISADVGIRTKHRGLHQASLGLKWRMTQLAATASIAGSMASTYSWQPQWMRLLRWLFQVTALYFLLHAMMSK